MTKTTKWFRNISLLDLLTGPLVLALPLSLVIFFSLNLNYDHHKSSIIKEFYDYTPYEVYSYADIIGDIQNERLFFKNYNTNATILAYDLDNSLIEGWNLEGYWYENPDFTIADLDHDGIKELYSLTINKGDSIFAGRTNLVQNSKNGDFIFADKLDRKNDKLDTKIHILGFLDITGDERKELIFSICAGFTLQPRAIYACDFNEGKIVRSPEAGIAYKEFNHIFSADLDMDSYPELFVSNTAPDNRENILYSDSASYLTIFSRDLKYFMKPVKMGGAQSTSIPIPLLRENDTLIAVSVSEQRSAEHKFKIVLFDKNGRKIRSLNYPVSGVQAQTLKFNNQLMIFDGADQESTISILNDSMDIEKTFKIEGLYSFNCLLNIDGDSADELLACQFKSSNLLILQDNLKEFNIVKLPSENITIENISLVSRGQTKSILSVDTDQGNYQISYSKNYFRPYRIPVYLLSYLVSFLILRLLQKLFLLRNFRMRERENKMMNLQLQSVMNQLNPHFTFNAINTIGDSILKGRSEEAYEYFTKLSELIRSSMTNAFQLDKTLQEEIDFVTRYLEIEEFRFSGRLSYSIEVSPSVKMQMKVPKMLIHIFVENAVKHGIFHKSTPGEIKVIIKDDLSGTLILVEDDGIGFRTSRSINKHEGKGLQILDNYLYLFGKSHETNISYTISELKPGAENPGTKVSICII